MLFVRKEPIAGTVKAIKPVQLRMVRDTELEPLWDEAVKNYHYLGHGKMLGARLKYLVFTGDILLAAIGFRSAGLKIECRDRFIGWSPEQRKESLLQIANNNRFLILPWVKVKNLASYLLSCISRQISQDWYNFYGQELLLLETYVDPQRFRGTIYKAANWIHVGQTKGYTRYRNTYRYHGNPKEVYLYPLRRNFRDVIGCKQCPVNASNKYIRSISKMLLTHDDWNPEVMNHLNVSPDEVKQLAGTLTEFHQKFAPIFVREEQRINSLVYLQGLLSDLDRKSAEPIALRFMEAKDVRNLQHFLTTGSWDCEALKARYHVELSRKISVADGMFTIDSSETPKKGKESAGVAHQYCGKLGKTANCQSGVFLGYASRRGYGLLDCQLYIPEKWFGDEYAERRKKCHMPEDLTFQSKPQIALELLKNAERIGAFAGKWVGIDSFFGSDPKFLDAIGERYCYFTNIRSDARVWLEKPEIGLPPYKGRGRYPKKARPLKAPIPVSEIAKDDSFSWQTVNMSEGAKGPIKAQVLCLRVYPVRDGFPKDECWLFLQRREDGTVKYALSNAPQDTTRGEMIRVSQMRWSIEQLFKDGKSYLGMDDYEVRSYTGWHRHMTLVFLAMLFLLNIRLEFGFKKNSNAPSGKVLGTNNSC